MSTSVKSYPSLETLIQETESLIPSKDRPSLHQFLQVVLTDLEYSTAHQPHNWHSPQVLASLFRFFQKPPSTQTEEVKVQALTGDENEETQIIIHLQDTPFILETLRNYLKKSGQTLYAQTHTTFAVRRDKTGKIEEILAEEESTKRKRAASCRQEMIIFILTEAMPNKKGFKQMREDLIATLTSVKQSVDDFPEATRIISQEASLLAKTDHTMDSNFLLWALDNNFVFMGMQGYFKKKGLLSRSEKACSLGIFRGANPHALLDRITPGLRQEIDAILENPNTPHDYEGVSVEYCQHGQSIIYDSEGVDFFTIRHPGSQADSWEMLLVLGRFSRTAHASRASTVPILAERLNETLACSGYSEGSYLRHEFRSLFDRMPLRELFYSEPEVLTEQIRTILKMQGDTDVSINVRLGHHGNYISILTVLSRNRYRAHLEEQVAEILSQYLDDPITSINVSESGTLFFIVCYANHNPKLPLTFDPGQVKEKIDHLVMTWEDGLRKILLESHPQRQALDYFGRYSRSFEPIYKESTEPEQAAKDIEIMESMSAKQIFASRLVRHQSGRTYVKLFSAKAVELTRMVQTFDHFGITCLHELSSTVKQSGRADTVIQCFEVGGTKEYRDSLYHQADHFSEALSALRENTLLDDRLNRLILLEGLSHWEVTLLQGLRQYQLQIHPELSVTKVNRVLLQNHVLARHILHLFLARFDPKIKNRQKRCTQILQTIESDLTQVANLQDDQVLRGLVNVVNATVRTNYFHLPVRPALSFKIDCSIIDRMPIPRPWREIFVFGPHVEGIHLRGGKVARGGLRFSDRLEDYRTEVLGLMKTQMVKNAIIVPLGAKGGFVIPRLEQKPKGAQKDWIATQYQTFIRALLDLTDNRVNEQIIHPENMVIHDEDDPYLVVAADKGTAAFSDLANTIAEEEYQFWLGDAFASGGSNGYDHKKVGITARGAWECIALHFEELGRDIHADPFTVVAIGDMAGDVFGNGMLASKQIHLQGAFNHIHIFLDPEPDPAASFSERERLFKLPRSSWTDYNPEIISAGGGVFERTAKAITLNPALQKLLDTKAASLSGEEVIKHLLGAKVDLLYNGGVGTYIKASTETHQDVSDKTNDSVRINGSDVRALIIGEGGNLGITQKGRLEISRFPSRKEGGRINTDALDNSGGVDLSDHEVNLKILLNHLVQIGEVKSQEDRNTMLASLSNEVANSVLEDNRMQHQAISRDMLNSIHYGDIYLDTLTTLHEKAGLDYVAEDMPEPEELAEWLKDNKGLPRPLLAIMLGYAKLFLQKRLLSSNVVDMLFFEHHLSDYFPASIGREFDPHLSAHFLKREIISSRITNRVINQTGVGHLFAVFNKVRDLRNTDNPLALLVKAYLIVDNLIDAPSFRNQIHHLGPSIPTSVKYQALDEMERVILHLAKWMLFHLNADRISIDVINLYAKIIRAFRNNLWYSLPDIVSKPQMDLLNKRRKELINKGLPEQLSTETVLLPFLRDIMTILHIKESLHTHFEPVGHLYIQVDDFFGLSWIDNNLKKVQPRDHWGRMNIENLRKELLETRTRLVEGIITFKRHNESVAEAFQSYLQEVSDTNVQYQELLEHLRSTDKPDHMPLSVLVRKLRELILHPQI
ncbi:MAG: NAD-glutamate dehydrogenase [Magnetococcales bacterium]|nr:NAD-glutamate dehydrogenase [Magnetococcales bacterium]